MDRLPADSLDEVIRQALAGEPGPDGWNPRVILTDSLRLFNPPPRYRASGENWLSGSVRAFVLTPELVDRIAEQMIQAVRNGESPETALSVLTLIRRPEVRDAAEHAVIHRAGLSEQALQEALFVLAQYEQTDQSQEARKALGELANSGEGDSAAFARDLLKPRQNVLWYFLSGLWKSIFEKGQGR